MTVLAMVLAAAAAGLAVGPWTARRAAPSGRSRGTRVGRPVVAVVAGVLVGVLTTLLDGSALSLALIGLLGAGGVLRLWRRAGRRREEDRRRSAVVELGEALVGELRAGQPVLVALERAEEVWAPFASVVAAFRLGADVPAALRRLATQPGAEGLREVAAAWQVSQRSGTTLATVLAQVAASARAQQSAARLVRAELASARATARLVAVLPVATLAMSAGAGAAPWRFLLFEPVGLACLGAGVALILTGLTWIERIAAAVTRP